MSKTIEDKAQEFAGINEDKKCNYSFSYNKYDIANAFQNGAEFGYALAESRIKKEYEWKLRWIPIEEEMPKNYSAVLAVIKSPSCTWVEEIGYGDGKFQLPGRGNTDFVTHWMYLPEPPPFL